MQCIRLMPVTDCKNQSLLVLGGDALIYCVMEICVYLRTSANLFPGY